MTYAHSLAPVAAAKTPPSRTETSCRCVGLGHLPREFSECRLKSVACKDFLVHITLNKSWIFVTFRNWSRQPFTTAPSHPFQTKYRSTTTNTMQYQ